MVKKILFSLLFLSLLAACSSQPAAEQKELPTYRIGYMICNSEQETLDRFIPMSAYLGEQLGVRFETVPIDTIRFTREIENLDFVHTNSLLYIILNRFNGVEVLAAEKKGALGHKSQGIILALKKSGLQSIKDLKGKSMIFGPMLAPTGFMAQLDLLQQNDLDIEDDLANYTIPGGSFKHEKVIYGVLFERYDAGSIPLDDLEIMVADNRIDADNFIILAKSNPIPYCNFAVPQKTDENLARKFKKAVLALEKKDTVAMNGEVVRVLRRAKIDGYVDVNDADFDIVREMAKRTNMPPYQKF